MGAVRDDDHVCLFWQRYTAEVHGKGVRCVTIWPADQDTPDTGAIKKQLDRKLREVRHVHKTRTREVHTNQLTRPQYKRSIDRVAKMLKNRESTTFVTVCVAEHLSISESRRLLESLAQHQIHTSHVVVSAFCIFCILA